MGCGEAVRGVDRIAWPGDYGFNNATPRSGGRQPGPVNPSQAKTPAEALSHIDLLYKSGRMEDLAKLLRKSQVFRAAWLIVQQSAPNVSEKAGQGQVFGSWGKSDEPAPLPVPTSGPPSLSLDPTPAAAAATVPGVANTLYSSQVPAVRLASEEGNDSCASPSRASQPLSVLLQVYHHQDDCLARKSQRGQLVSIWA